MDKQEILDAIRGTAMGGVAVGHRQFASQTGIGQSEWSRYWARWGDAVREAGLEPSRWSEAFNEDVLVEHLIVLARAYGRLPVNSEIRLQARTGSGFPSDKTFRRLGSKSQLMAKVREYCQGRPGYEDVLLMCSASTETGGHASASTDEDSKESRGFVYLMKHGRHYKIGKTNAVGRREYELGIQLPEKLTRVHVIETDDPAGIETYWHTRFASRRGNGEWFQLTPADVKAFKSRKRM